MYSYFPGISFDSCSRAEVVSSSTQDRRLAPADTRIDNVVIERFSDSHKDQLKAHFHSLSRADLRARFMHYADKESIVNYVDKINFAADYVFGAYTSNRTLIGCSHLNIDKTSGIAEVSLSVASEYRKQGCGSSMLKYSIEVAKENGCAELKIDCLFDNHAMLNLAIKTGFSISRADGSSFEGSYKFK